MAFRFRSGTRLGRAAAVLGTLCNLDLPKTNGAKKSRRRSLTLALNTLRTMRSLWGCLAIGSLTRVLCSATMVAHYRFRQPIAAQ